MWAISELGIFSRKDGTLRGIEFPRLHGLNVISGRAGTGKSALLDIVDYCLASDSCSIPVGKIRDSVSHVGIRLTNKSQHIVIIRPVPTEGFKTSSKIFIDRGSNISLPEVVPQKTGYTVSQLKGIISEFTGIYAREILTEPGGQKRFDANIRHTKPYLSQPQDLIASRAALFPGLDDYFKTTAIKESAPYFFGIIDPEGLEVQIERRELSTEEKTLRRELDNLKQLSSIGGPGESLLRRAIALGMVDPIATKTREETITALESAKVTSFEKIEPKDKQRILDLRREERNLRVALRHKSEQLLDVDRFLNDFEEHATIIESQRSKLDFLNILPPATHAHCPFCGSDSGANVLRNEIESAMKSLEEVRRLPSEDETRLMKRRASLQNEVKELTNKTRQVSGEREGWESQVVNVIKNEHEQLSLLGQIRQYLEAQSTQPARLEGALEKIIKRRAALGDSSSPELQSRVSHQIGKEAQRISKRLQFEYGDSPMRFSFDNLNIEIETRKRWLTLGEVGSGANWVKMHVAACLAVHKHFVTENTPVPRFLMLDQPSQAWFPPDKIGRHTIDDEADRTAVAELYQTLTGEVEKIGGLQLIVVDHARPNIPGLKKHIVEEWRESAEVESPHEALVPESWML